jgi:serine/threonine-protein kinase
MLTASLPFMAESALGIITKHLTERPVPPRERKPEWNIPLALEQVCMMAMTKDRDARYPDAAVMSKALRDAVLALGEDADKRLGSFELDGDTEVLPVEQPKDETPNRSYAWAAALIVLGAAAVGLALYSAGEGEHTEGTTGEGPIRTARPPRDASIVAQADTDADIDDADIADVLDDASTDDALDAATDTSQRPGVTSDPGPRPSMGRGMNRRSSVDEPTMEAPTESPGQVAYEQGRERFLANDIRGAIARFEEAARLMPSNAQVQKQLGRAHMRAGSVADAVAAYRRYLELAPNAPDRAIIERLITQAQ